MDILRKEWYRLNAISTEGMSPRDIGYNVGMKAGILKAMNLINVVSGAEQQGDDDKEYQISTREKYEEFNLKRNYHYSNTPNPIDFPKCWCHTCRPIKLDDMRMILCPDCGNKRCPRANHHDNECTNSNDPGQKGSAYQ
jgi:hypothetical protein